MMQKDISDKKNNWKNKKIGSFLIHKDPVVAVGEVSEVMVLLL